MLDWLNNAVLSLADPLLNWLLRLSTDLTLVIVAVGTGAILTLARLLTTNQDLLRRCDQDKERLKELMREAKRQKDREAVKRYRNTRTMIGVTAIRQEGWPLLAAIVPIAILGTWCFQRLAFVPPRAGQSVQLAAYFPVSAVGQVAHLVPQEGLHEVSARRESGNPAGRANLGGRERWIQEIVEDPGTQPRDPAGAVANWTLQADASEEPYRLQIRYKTCTVQKQLLVGQPVYSPDVEFYGGDGRGSEDPAQTPIQCVQIGMEPVKFLGVVPGIAWLLMPPWLVAYFLIAVPSVGLIKRVTGIY